LSPGTLTILFSSVNPSFACNNKASVSLKIKTSSKPFSKVSPGCKKKLVFPLTIFLEPFWFLPF
jgi:hypothetical protein